LRVVNFDVRKYGRYLLADAGSTDALPGFITSPEPHRLTFYEIALVEDGDGYLELDGEALEVRPNRVIVTAPGEARSWRLDERGLRARVAFFDPRVLDGLTGPRSCETAFPFLAAPRSTRTFTPPHRDFARMTQIVADMRDELAAPRADSAELLRAQLLHLLVLAKRHGAGAGHDVRDAGADLAQRFSLLVERKFTVWPGVADYAHAMRVSARHLNACVRHATGRTASAVIHDRLVLESQRRLLGTSESAAVIAEALGFSDASYFVRFFRRHTGCTPAVFRRHRGSPIVHRKTD
jgi:AraC family transcriptional activator of pobA